MCKEKKRQLVTSRTVNINIRVTAHEKAMIIKLADEAMLTVTQFLVRTALDRSKEQ